MKIANWIPWAPGSILLTLFLCGGACAPEAIDLNSNDTANIQNETASDAYFADSEDISSVTVSSDNATNGGRIQAGGGSRQIIVNDPRLACATVTLELAPNSTLLIPKGLLTIDFGSGCTDNHGNTRKGIISITFNGRRFLPGSSVVTTLTGYEINGVKIEGTRSVANESNSTQADPHFTTTMTGGIITWPDGTTTERNERVTREWKLGATSIDNQWLVTGTATGKNRNDLNYSMTITNTLVYRRYCAVNNEVYMPVSGTKQLVVSDKKITIDFGAGACDKLVTVTINSKSKIVDLGNN